MNDTRIKHNNKLKSEHKDGIAFQLVVEFGNWAVLKLQLFLDLYSISKSCWQIEILWGQRVSGEYFAYISQFELAFLSWKIVSELTCICINIS